VPLTDHYTAVQGFRGEFFMQENKMKSFGHEKTPEPLRFQGFLMIST